MHSGKNDKKFGQGPPPPWFGNNPKEQQLFFEMSSLTVDRKVFSSTKPLQFEVRRRWSTYGPLITPFSHDLKNWRTFHNQAFVEKSIVLCCCGTCSLITITLNEVNIALSCKKHTCLVKMHLCGIHHSTGRPWSGWIKAHMCGKNHCQFVFFTKWQKPNMCGFYQTHTKYKCVWKKPHMFVKKQTCVSFFIKGVVLFVFAIVFRIF